LAKFGVYYSHKKGDTVDPNQWRFPGKKQKRIADIAMLDSHRNPRVLVEIKDADAGKKENEAQIDDYFKYIEKHEGVEFLFLSRHIPDERKEGRTLQKGGKHVHQRLFRDLYKALTDSGVQRISGDPFSRMLREYLEDINVTYRDQKPDPETLQYITRRLLALGGRRVAERSVPEFFSVVFDDLSSTGQWIQGANPGLFKQGFKRQIYVEPWHNVRRLQVEIGKASSKKVQELDDWLGDYCYGGEVYFGASGYLTHNRSKAISQR
jgi:hypothetical protein